MMECLKCVTVAAAAAAIGIGQFIYICIYIYMVSLYSIIKNSNFFHDMTLFKTNFIVEVSILKIMSYILIVSLCLYFIKEEETKV